MILFFLMLNKTPHFFVSIHLFLGFSLFLNVVVVIIATVNMDVQIDTLGPLSRIYPKACG